mmetsp:Transcript_31236/g.89555  ORF Transcript_31236/g.89555 Transcript_31236/m.89555 type:complete len:252 (+) Transcript_31236:2032-2787(+)
MKIRASSRASTALVKSGTVWALARLPMSSSSTAKAASESPTSFSSSDAEGGPARTRRKRVGVGRLEQVISTGFCSLTKQQRIGCCAGTWLCAMHMMTHASSSALGAISSAPVASGTSPSPGATAPFKARLTRALEISSTAAWGSPAMPSCAPAASMAARGVAAGTSRATDRGVTRSRTRASPDSETCGKCGRNSPPRSTSSSRPWRRRRVTLHCLEASFNWSTSTKKWVQPGGGDSWRGGLWREIETLPLA